MAGRPAAGAAMSASADALAVMAASTVVTRRLRSRTIIGAPLLVFRQDATPRSQGGQRLTICNRGGYGRADSCWTRRTVTEGSPMAWNRFLRGLAVAACLSLAI